MLPVLIFGRKNFREKEKVKVVCKKCGKEIERGDWFCNRCGERIDRKEKITSKTWFILLTYFTITPIGIYFMWRHKKFKKGVRILMTAIFIFVCLFNKFSRYIYFLLMVLDYFYRQF